MDGAAPEEGPALHAGELSAWLVEVRAAIRGEAAIDVPCGACTACCRSSQFVHVAPEETDTLAHIPARLLFPAPLLAPGHMVLGYDERGHCPMLVDGKCSIYDHRPRACRQYDCRVFAVAGVDPGDDGRPEIARQARRWRFAVDGAEGQARVAAVRAAVDWLRHDAERPLGTTQLAAAAVEAHEAFLDGPDPDPGEVRAALRRPGNGPATAG